MTDTIINRSATGFRVCAFLAFFLAAAVSEGSGSVLRVLEPSGSFVFTTTGTQTIRWSIPAGFPGAVPEVTVKDAHGNTVAPADSSAARSQADVYAFPEYGWYELTARLKADNRTATGTVSIAVVPDNSRSGISTTSPFAMGCYFAMRYTAEELRAASRLAAIAGVSFSREELRWDICEPKKGEYTWSKFDAGVRACLDSNIGVLGLLDYWGSYHDGRTGFTERGVSDFAAYVSRTVNRYKPGGEFFGSGACAVSDWEIWNEPATFWFYTPGEFGQLTRAAYNAAHRSDKDSRVFFANAGDSFDEKAMKAMDGRAFDGVAPHFYCPPRSPKEAKLSDMLSKQIAFYAKQNIKAPFWITEMGWHSDNSQAKQLVQADYLVQSYVMALAAGYEKVFWYNFVCDVPDKNAPEYGLLHRGDLSPKIAYAAFAGMVHRLEGARFLKSLNLGRNISCHVFEREADGQVAVVWADEGSGRLRPAGNAAIQLFDMFSNPIETAAGAIPLVRSPHFVTAQTDLPKLFQEVTIEGIAQIDLELKPTTGAFKAGSKIEFVASNHTKAACEVKVTPTAEHMELTRPDPVQIDAESSAPVVCGIRKVKTSPENSYPLNVAVSVAGGSSLQKKFTLTEKLIRRGTAKIDGRMDEWTTAMPMRLDSAEQAVGINPWMEWNLSAVYYFMHDDANLYFGARVRDNIHAQPHAGELIWEGDSWQIGIDAEPGSLKSEVGKFCYGLALTDSGPRAVSWQGGNAGPITTAVARQPSTTRPTSPGGPPAGDDLIYECAIPRELLAPAILKAGSRIGISVLLNDNDGGGRAGWMESSPAIGTGFNPQMFDLFELE